MYYEVCIKKENADDMTRKNMIRSLFGSCRNHKLGMIEKFNNSHGYKKVTWDMTTQYPTMIEPAVKTPDDYVAPVQMIMNNIWADFSENGVVKVIIEEGMENHPDEHYSYNRARIAGQITDFFAKVYPDFNVRTRINLDKSFDYTDKEFIKNFCYLNLACEDDTCVTIECSSGEQMSEDDCEEIREACEGLNDFQWHLESFFCETCKEYHPDAPYHNIVVFN